jgi:hypothetical protein
LKFAFYGGSQNCIHIGSTLLSTSTSGDQAAEQQQPYDDGQSFQDSMPTESRAVMS